MRCRRLALAGLFLFACKSDQKEPPAEAPKPAAAPEKPVSRAEAIANAPTPLAPGMTRLEALDLQIKLPPGSKLPPPSGSIYDLILPNSVFVTVKEIDEHAPKTMDDAKIRAHDYYAAKQVQTETLPDGWTIQFESDVGSGRALWIHVRRKFGDKEYECSGNAFKPEDAAPIIEACKSLKR